MADDFGHINTGDRWKPTAFEINAMKDAARAHQGGAGISQGENLLSGLNCSPVVVRVKNTLGSGSAVDRYTWWSVENPRWTIDANMKLVDVIFELVGHHNEKIQAVVQEPIKSGEFGTAVISGATLIKTAGTGSASDRYGTNSGNGILSPASEASNGVRLAHDRPTGGGYALAVIDQPVPTIQFAPRLKIIKTPPGGLPAATVVTEDTNGPLTLSYNYQDCYEYIHNGTPPNIYNAIRQAAVVRVSNPSLTDIPGDIIIPAYNFTNNISSIQNQWWAIWPGADGTSSPWVYGAIGEP